MTTTQQHMRNIVQFVGEVTEGRGSTYLLFKTMPSLASLEKAPPPTPYILTAPWQRAGHPYFRIDQP